MSSIAETTGRSEQFTCIGDALLLTTAAVLFIVLIVPRGRGYAASCRALLLSLWAAMSPDTHLPKPSANARRSFQSV